MSIQKLAWVLRGKTTRPVDVQEGPEEYRDYLKAVGWGENALGWMFYGGPVEATEFIPDAEEPLRSMLFVADDFQGFHLAYDTAGTLHVVDSCDRSAHAVGTLEAYFEELTREG